MFYLAWEGFPWLLEIAADLYCKTIKHSSACAETTGWVSQMPVRKLTLKWNAAIHVSLSSIIEGLNCSQTGPKALRGISNKKKEQAETPEFSQRKQWNSATSTTRHFIFNWKEKKKNRHNNILLMFRNIDLEQNILFSIIESKHLVSQIKMPKKEKALQILKLTFLLQVKVIFLFQHDFAKK